MEYKSLVDFVSKVEFTNVFELSLNLVAIIDTKGIFFYSNNEYSAHSGYTGEQLLKLNFRDLLTDNFESKFDFIMNELNFTDAWKGEIEHKKFDNSIYWTTSYFTKIKSEKSNETLGFLVVEDDITSLKHLTTQLEMKANLLFEEKMKIEAILNDIPFGILVLDDFRTIIYENLMFRTYFREEFERELLINSTIDNYLPNDFLKEIKQILLQKLNKELIYKFPSGKHWQVDCIFLEKSDGDSLSIVIIRDISSAVEFDLIQKQFVTSISHELRTPIASIMLSINNYLSFQEKLSTDQKDNLLNIIKQNSSILANIVEDLLIISNIDNKKLNIRNWNEINIKDQINEVIFQLKPQIEMKKLNIIFKCEEKINFFSDPDRLKQIIRIPLDNAIKYSIANNDIIIEVKESYQGTYNPLNQEGILFSIKDFGIGIEQSDLQYMFKRYFRSKNAQNIQGTGIGLSILKDLVNLLKGIIKIESLINNYTIIYIFLPYFEKQPN